MSTAFEPSLSTSAMRPPLSSADAPSMADSLPSINFGFDELRDRMAKFTVKFDSFIEQGRKRVLEERNQFRMNVTELKGMQTWSTPSLLLTQTRGSTNEEERHRDPFAKISYTSTNAGEGNCGDERDEGSYCQLERTAGCPSYGEGEPQTAD